MTNRHAHANSVIPTASNGIPFLLTNLLHYVNLFFVESGTIAKRNGIIFCQNDSIVGSNGWCLVINGSRNGF